LRHDLPHFFDRVQSNIEIDAGKRLSSIKLFTVPIETAVIISGELGFPSDLASQKAAGERKPY
jgi:hypothetical protein